MRVLDAQQTASAIDAYGLERAGESFAFRDTAGDVAYDWHAHGHHQLLYAASGAAQLETETARFVLPPQRAAWIPAGTRHRTLLSSVEGASIFFASDAVARPGDRARIIAAGPLLREMAMHALRWPPGAAKDNPLAKAFFHTLALLCAEWLQAELSLALPASAHPAIRRAMDYALTDPGAADQPGAIAAAHLSERSFRRLFTQETGGGWQAWLTQARIMAAMARLEAGGRVTDVAADVGFASLSAFAKAFARIAGESPAAYRKRVRDQSGA
jgi:AraC-like DNA-binding protein